MSLESESTFCWPKWSWSWLPEPPPLIWQGTQVAGQVPSCFSSDQKTQMRSIWILRVSSIAYLYWVVQLGAMWNECACLLMHGLPSAMLLPLLPPQWNTSHLLPLLTSLNQCFLMVPACWPSQITALLSLPVAFALCKATLLPTLPP